MSLSRDLRLARGSHSVAWKPPGRGRYRLRIEAQGPSGPLGVETRSIRVTTPKPSPRRRSRHHGHGEGIVTAAPTMRLPAASLELRNAYPSLGPENVALCMRARTQFVS